MSICKPQQLCLRQSLYDSLSLELVGRNAKYSNGPIDTNINVKIAKSDQYDTGFPRLLLSLYIQIIANSAII